MGHLVSIKDRQFTRKVSFLKVWHSSVGLSEECWCVHPLIVKTTYIMLCRWHATCTDFHRLCQVDKNCKFKHSVNSKLLFMFVQKTSKSYPLSIKKIVLPLNVVYSENSNLIYWQIYIFSENWLRELSAWCPELRVIVYYGSQEERRETRHSIMYGGNKDFHVLLTT